MRRMLSCFVPSALLFLSSIVVSSGATLDDLKQLGVEIGHAMRACRACCPVQSSMGCTRAVALRGHGPGVRRHALVLKDTGQVAPRAGLSRCCSWGLQARKRPLPMPTCMGPTGAGLAKGGHRESCAPHHVRFRRRCRVSPAWPASNPPPWVVSDKQRWRRDARRWLYFRGIRALTGARLPHSHRYCQRAGWRSGEPPNYHAAEI